MGEGVHNNEKEATDDSELSKSVLKIEHHNAKDRLIDQRETLRIFSEEASQIIRLILLLVAAPIAVIGAIGSGALAEVALALTANDCAVYVGSLACLSVAYTSGFTMFMLMVSALANISASGYDDFAVRTYTNPEDVDITLSSPQNERTFYEERLMKYRLRIEQNDRLIRVLEFLLAMGKVGFAGTVLGVGTLTFVLLQDSSITVLWWLLFAALLTALLHVLPENVIQSEGIRIWKFSPPYSTDYEAQQNDDADGNLD